MSAENDASDFIDSDFQSQKTAHPASLPLTAAGSGLNRLPTREEIESLVSEKQIKLAELKRAQEELERERAHLEELRRRQIEFQTGRQEMLQNLTRGVGLLEEAELTARREADEMERTLREFREATSKVQAINEQLWTSATIDVELTRALTTLENARMEWNAARLKFAILSGVSTSEEAGTEKSHPVASLFTTASLLQLCKIGFALTWPLALLGLGIFLSLLLRK